MIVVKKQNGKKQKFKIIPIIVLVVLLSTLYIGVHQAKLFAKYVSTQAEPVNVVEGEVSQENVHLKYPQVEGLKNEGVQSKINSQIANEVNAFREPVDQKDHSVDTRYSLELNKNNIISLTLTESHYKKMMAHPMHYMKGMTINTKTGQVYNLVDLFKTNSDYQTRINGMINQQIVDKDMHLLKPFEGIKPDQEFYLTGDGIVIYYQLYDYTPYVYGFSKFNIPYDQVADIMQKGLIQ